MSYTTDAAESVIRFTLNGAERLLRISGRGARDLSLVLRSVLKNKRSGPGKERVQDLLTNGRNVKIFQLPKTLLKAFTCEAKRYGVRFAAVKNLDDKEHPTVDILVSEIEGAKVCRILEKCRDGKADLTRLEAEALDEARRITEAKTMQARQKQKTDPAGNIIEGLVPPDKEEEPVLPMNGAAGRKPLSAPSYKNKERSNGRGGYRKPSVKEALNALRRENETEEREGLGWEIPLKREDGDRER